MNGSSRPPRRLTTALVAFAVLTVAMTAAAAHATGTPDIAGEARPTGDARPDVAGWHDGAPTLDPTRGYADGATPPIVTGPDVHAPPLHPTPAGGPATLAVDNGNFETGDLSSWVAVHSGSGNWSAYSGNSAPITGAPVATPPEGSYAATTDQTGPGTHILYQDVTVPSDGNSTLSFYLYYENENGAFHTPDTLAHDGEANQQYRVDVLTTTAAPDSVAPGDVLEMLYRTEVGDPASLPPTGMAFDLSAYAGTEVRLRFAEVDNQLYFRASVDAVAFGNGSAPPPPPPPGPGADLVVLDITLDPASPAPGQGIVFTATVHNQGNETAAASGTRFEIDAPGGPSTTVSTPSLPPGATVNVSTSPSPGLPAGNHTISATADALNGVPEGDETNNDRIEVFAVGDGGGGDRPANDDFANGLPLVLPTSHVQSTHGATVEPGEPRPCGFMGATVWFKFRVNGSVVVRADTFGSNYDTVLAAYAGSPSSPITCNDDAFGSRLSEVVFAAEPGLTYYLQVGGSAGDSGTLVLNVEEFLAPDPAVIEVGVAKTQLQTDLTGPFANPLTPIQVTVEIANLEPHAMAQHASLTLSICPSSGELLTPPHISGCDFVDGPAFQLEGGETRTVELDWQPTGSVGDYDVCAIIAYPHPENIANNIGCEQTFVLVGGTGLGGLT